MIFKNSKHTLILFGTALLLSVVYLAFIYYVDAKRTKDIRELVETFGSHMQHIPLLGTQEEITQAMEEHYGPLVTSPVLIAELVADALEDPTQVPGRLTSSPFPHRIRITTTEDLSRYTTRVTGEVEEVTSDGTIVHTQPITLLVEKRRDRGNRWFIAHITLQTKDDTEEVIGNTQLEQAIQQYLLTQKTFSWHTKEGSHTVCTLENLDPESPLFPLYLWAHCGEYSIENGTLVSLSGSSIPVKIQYPNELSYYALQEFSHEIPRDGASYAEDIKNIFPEHVQKEISQINRKLLIEKNESQALATILAWDRIVEAVRQCEVTSVFQSHSRNVSVERKDGSTLSAVEPAIDDIFDVVLASEKTCGRILMATE